MWNDVAMVGVVGLSRRDFANVFHRDVAGDWQQIVKLTPSIEPNDNFGASVSVYGNRAVVSVSSRTGIGEAFLFQFDVNGIWKEIATLLPSDGQPKEAFGFPVAIGSDDIFVANQSDGDRGQFSGSTYVFRVPVVD